MPKLFAATAAVAVALVGATAGAYAQPRPTVVFLGDSLSAGLGVDPAQAFPTLVQQRIDQAGLDFEVVNAGVSGETSTAGRRRIDWLLRRPMSVLVVELGGNDGLRGTPIETTRDNLLAIVQSARAADPETAVVIAGMRVPTNMGSTYGDAFHALYAQVAAETDATLIPFLLEGVGGEPSLNQADGIHPNAAGHAIIAETVWRTLEPILRAQRDPF